MPGIDHSHVIIKKKRLSQKGNVFGYLPEKNRL